MNEVKVKVEVKVKIKVKVKLQENLKVIVKGGFEICFKM